uniref:Uncharacterized protein n=1 Tax=Tanacetum cinerariifolium TaxID=118510 RepID=A0A699H9Q7_TANCI|nr:hypothetical protein VITISV_003809 [Tanacetum cinerariifolium]
MFDEFSNPSPSVVSPVPTAVARIHVDPTSSHVSTSLEHDAPSASTSSAQEQEHYPLISQGVEESLKTPYFHDYPLYETLHEDSTSQGSSLNMGSSHTPLDLLCKWTKNHPLVNVIGDPSRSVFTRKHLKIDAIFLLSQEFSNGAVDLTLFTKKPGRDILLTRPRIYSVQLYMCARYQAKPVKKHLHAIKRIFRYLKGTIDMGLDDCFSVTGYNRNGTEVGGYGENRATFARFVTRVLPYPHMHQELILEPGTHAYQLLGDDWNRLVEALVLEDVVFQGAATSRRQQLQLSYFEQQTLKKYCDLILCLLVVKQNNELLMKNHESRPTGSAPLPEANVVTYQSRGRGRGLDRG